MSYRRKYADQAHALSAINSARALWAIGRQWLTIAAAFGWQFGLLRLLKTMDGLGEDVGWVRLSAPSLCALAAGSALTCFIIACKQHSLGVIMHDATHHRLLANKRLNELVSNWLCAFPVGMITASYRRSHLPHHSFTNAPLDPYWARMVKDATYQFPQRRGAFARVLFRDLVGMGLREWWPVLRAWTGWAFVIRDRSGFLKRDDRAQFSAFWGLAIALTLISGTWAYLLVFWITPMFTIALMFSRIRIVAEHELGEHADELLRTRHVDGTWLERLAIAPLAINYHIAHHLFPSIPHYNLKRMHSILLQDQEFCEHACRWPRYFGKGTGLINSMLT